MDKIKKALFIVVMIMLVLVVKESLQTDHGAMQTSNVALASKKGKETKDNVKIQMPEVTLVNTNNFTIKVRWKKCVDAKMYEVYRSNKEDGKFTKIASVSKCSYADKDVTKGTTYYYQVKALGNKAGDRIESPLSKVKHESVKLDGIKVSLADVTGTKVFLKWKKSKNDVKYVVYRTDKKGGNYKEIGKTKKNTFTDKSVKPECDYFYRVVLKKKNHTGNSVETAPSKTVKAKTKKKVNRTAYVGDSIMAGFGEYGVIREKGKKVVAKIGVSSYSFYNGSIMDELLDYEPDRIFISLGMNGLDGNPSGAAMDQFVKYYKDIIEECKYENPDVQIIVLAVSPTSHSATVKVANVRKYNEKQKKMAEKCGVYYYDYTSFLKESDGSLKSCYNDGDGIHWKKSAYDKALVILNKYAKKLD